MKLPTTHKIATEICKKENIFSVSFFNQLIKELYQEYKG
jgi:hypothetical protein